MAIDLNKQAFLVLGLGRSGQAVLHWLHQQGAEVRAADSHLENEKLEQLREGLSAVQFVSGAFEQSLLDGVDVVVVSPGIALDIPVIAQAKAQGIQVIGDIELFAQFKPKKAKVIGITGVNGKTTVTTLVGEICKAAGLNTIVAGNIGLPVMEAIQLPAPDVYVLELSSFQLETTETLRIDAATMLNLTQDHMDRYEDMQAYAIAKARIFYHAAAQVLNRDDAWSMLMERPKLQQWTFGLGSADDKQAFGLVAHENGHWITQGDQLLINVADLKLIGTHNITNAMAAMALCQAIDIPHQAILQALYAFEGLPHRVQWVTTDEDVEYFNDSKATNVGATIAAVEGLNKPVVLIAGGEAKDQSFKPLAAHADKLRAVVLIGRDAAQIEQVLIEKEVPMYQALDMAEAVTISQKLAKAGDAVLLSPACASFDMFDNYQHRGEVFIDAVQRLTNQAKVSH